MAEQALSEADIEAFVEDGYTVLRGGFPESVATKVRERLWARMELSPDAPESWPARVVYIKETYGGGPFVNAYTDLVTGAFDQLLGHGRWIRDPWMGFWPILFPGFAEGPWTPPTSGWHVDGAHFRRHCWSPDRALLTLFLFSDVGPGDGGTAVSVGSHHLVARVLAEAEPDGLAHKELLRRANGHARTEVREVTGQAGDVVLLHPFLLHAQSVNTGDVVRFMANPFVAARDRLDLRGGATPVERAIRRGIGQAGAERTPAR